MPISKHHIAIRGDECQCGRRKSVLHCPFCGSTQVRTYANPRFHKHLNGDVKEVASLRHCNACGKNFTDDEREFCNATPIGAADAARKLQILAEAESSPNQTQDQRTASTTAKALLDALRQVQQPSAAETHALEVLEKQTIPTEEQRYNEYIHYVTVLRGEYNQEVYKYRTEGKEHPDTEEEYVAKCLEQYGIEKVEKPK